MDLKRKEFLKNSQFHFKAVLNWLFSRILFRWSKCLLRKEKNHLSGLSHDVRKSFSANKSYHFFFYIKDLKPVVVTYACL